MKYQKHFLLATAAILAAVNVNVAANPILSHKYTADPQPIIWNDRLYVYASNDDKSIVESDGYVIHDYTLVSTDDMVNWTDHGEVFNRSTMNWNFVYAPGAAVRNGKVYLYPCGAGGPVGVAVADRPEGPFRDGRTLVDRQGANSCTNCNVPWMFDPHVFVDTDGQAYLYYGGGQDDSPSGVKFGQNMRVIRLNNDMVSRMDNAATTIVAPRSFEAANMHKRGNTYYFSYVNNWDGGDGHPNAAIMYMTGTSPMGPFTLQGAVLENPTLNGNNINRHNNNHHAAIEYPAGSDKWYMFYHDRRVANANEAPSVNQRNISVDSLVYNADGTMRKVVVTADGVRQIKNLNPYDTIRATTMNRQQGIKTASGGESSVGGMKLISIGNNDWVRLRGVDFGEGATKFVVRAASNNSGGDIELRTGSQTGTLIGTCAITSTGGWSTWRNFDCDVNKSASAGVKDFLYLVFKGGTDMFDLSWYKFEGGDPTPPPEPNEYGWWFIDPFEEDLGGWGGRMSETVATSTATKAMGVRSLEIAGRTATWHGAMKTLPSVFTAGTAYAFSVCAVYLEGGENVELLKFTLQYTDATDTTRWLGIDSLTAARGQWVHLRNSNLMIPAGATDLRIIVESPSNAEITLYIDEAIGAVGGTSFATPDGVSTSGTSSVKSVVVNGSARPLVSVRGRTLSVSSPNNSELTVRMFDVRGRVRATFDANGSGNFALTNIPAGRYFVDVRGIGGVRQTLPVVVR